MPTLTASPVMKARVEKAAIPAAQHALHKSSAPWIFPAAAASNEGAKSDIARPVVEEDPAILAERRGRIERHNALFMKLRGSGRSCSRRRSQC